MISSIIAAVIQIANPHSTPSVPDDAKPRTMEGRSTEANRPAPEDEFGRNASDVAYATIHDGTDGLLETTVPSVSFDQPLAIRENRTGLVTVYPDIVMRRRPTMIVRSSSSASDAYRIAESENQIVSDAPTQPKQCNRRKDR